ncbi:MAG: SUMF1/EgtB/PvdO family nonheme iron enzyme, partial [Planctomycetaceae bacterium]|nr:SUMF1/EgtB/PvdO family nonheme iron enzyme [Planctomycetaceae bacterium]
MTTLLLVSALMIAEPTDKQLPLLKTFRQEFISITPGRGDFPRTFTMGTKGGKQAAEQPAHEVTVAHDFQVAKYEVPQDLWEAVMGSNPSRWKGPRNSVEMLTFKEAETFCVKVTGLLRAAKLIGPGEVVRLPSEAEWEYVARS